MKQMRTQRGLRTGRAARLAAALILALLAACGHLESARKPAAGKEGARAQLSIGYTLLYQEADGIPKLRWLLMFKDKSDEMARLTHELIEYYQQLAETLQRLSREYPAVHIDVEAMSRIESDTRKAIGADKAKDMAPLIGKSGPDFEREALLMFYDALNEQRHLTGVMIEQETVPSLKEFLQTTRQQLDTRYEKVGSLLNRRYFTH
jgi:hypothetical protein